MNDPLVNDVEVDKNYECLNGNLLDCILERKKDVYGVLGLCGL